MKKTTFLISLILMVTMVFGQYHGADPQDLQKLQAEREMQHLKEIKAAANYNLLHSKFSFDNNYTSNATYQADKSAILHYDGENDNALGLTSGGNMVALAYFTSAMIAPHVGEAITEIHTFVNTVPSGDYILKIFADGAQPGALLYSQDVTSQLVANAWNYFELTTPFDLVGGGIYVGFSTQHAAGQFPAGVDAGPANPNGDWASLDGGTAWDHIGNYGFGNWNIRAKVELLADPAAPAAPTLLMVEPADLGVVSAEISWTNPALTVDGEELTELLTVELYVSGEENPIYEDETPTIGAEDSYTFVGTESGFYTFTVLGTNTAGNGLPAAATVWLGTDVPAAPSNVVLAAVGNSGYLTWDAPALGLHGGYIDPANTVYNIVRMPGNVTVATGFADTEYTDATVPGIGNYYYRVTAENDEGLGGTANSNTVLLGAEGILLYETFTDVAVGQLPAGWAIQGLGQTNWSVQNTSAAGGTAPEMRLYFSPTFNGTSRLVTHPIDLDGHSALRLKLKHYLSNYAVVSNSLAIQVSFDAGATWDNIWSYPITGSIPATNAELYIDVPPGKSDMQIGWEFQGDVYQINNWNIDNVILEPVLENDLVAVSISGNSTPTVGVESQYTIKVQNAGTLTTSDYTVKLMKEGGVELASLPGEPIEFGEELTFVLNWTPDAADEGATYIYGYVEFAADEMVGNNQTANLALNVQPEGVVVVTIGTGTKLLYMPYNFLYDHSLSQTLYFPDEIGMTGGVITGLQYQSTFNAEYLDREIKIWIGETELTNLADGWVDPASLQLVFDGTVDFPEGINDIFITLDDIYIYGGGNLVIYSSKADVEWSGSKQFFGTETPNSNRSRRAQQDNTPMDPTAPPAGLANHDFPNIKIFFSTAGLGSLEGVVTDGTDPIEGVQVSILGTMAKVFTNANGEYSFPYVLPGTYDIEFSKFGYFDYVEEDVEILEDETTTIDVEINAIPQYTVVGVVKANDDSFIEGASIILSGYDIYNAVSIVDGEFEISDVYEGTYTISISYDGYITLVEDEIEVNETEAVAGVVDIGVFELVEIINAPYGLVVDVVENTALFKWNTGALELTEDFEGGAMPTGWSQVITNTTSHPGTGIPCTWNVNNYVGTGFPPFGTYHIGLWWSESAQNEWLITPEFVATASTTLAFNTYAFRGSTNGDHYYVKVSLDGGTTWTVVWDATAQTGEWTNYSTPIAIDLSAFAGNEIKVAFHAIDGNGQGLWYIWFIDNVAVTIDNKAITFEPKDFAMFSMVQTSEEALASQVSRDGKEPVVEKAEKAFVGYNVYLDDDLVTVDPIDAVEYLFTDLLLGTTYTAGVQSVYSSGVSEIVEIEFYILAINNVNFTVSNAITEGILEGAEIVVSLDGVEVETLVTDEDGIATLELYEGSYTYTVSFEGYQTQDGSFEIVAEGDTDVSVELEPYFTITFNVVDEDAEPILDAVVTFAGAASPAGTYTFERIRGTYTYSVSKTGYVASAGSVTIVDEDVQEDVVLDWVRFTVTFNVKNSANDPIEGATITIEDHDPATTNAAGTAVMQMLNGSYSFSVSHDDYHSHTGEFTVSGAPLSHNLTLIAVSTETISWNNVKLFPNPFSEHITISNPEMVKRVIITNLIGQVVQDIVFNGEETIETTNLQGGVYLLTIEGINGEKSVRKMIKK